MLTKRFMLRYIALSPYLEDGSNSLGDVKSIENWGIYTRLQSDSYF